MNMAYAQFSQCTVPVNNALMNSFNTVNTCSTTVDVAASQQYSLGFIDVSSWSSAANNARTDITDPNEMFHISDYLVGNMGNLYGLAVDDTTGTVYTSASSNYSIQFGWQPDEIQDAVITYGALGGGENVTGAGAVYVLDPVTGEPSLFSTLPQNSVTVTNLECEPYIFGVSVINPTIDDQVRNNVGVGLGNLVFDNSRGLLFVANWEDGRIYRLDSTGEIIDAYDPGASDDGSAGFAPDSVVPYGLAVSPDGSQLFYGTMEQQIYSIDLTADGAFNGTSSTVSVAGTTFISFENATETLHFDGTPNNNATSGSGEILEWYSDLEFTPSGDLMVGERLGCAPNEGGGNGAGFASSYNHDAETFFIQANDPDGLYNDNRIEPLVSYDAGTTDPDPAAIGASTGTGVFQMIDGNESYGGVTWFDNADGSVDYVLSSSDILSEQGPHGIVVFNQEDVAGTPTTSAEISPLGAINYIDGSQTVSAFDLKGIGGDVEALQPYICPPVGSWSGNVSEDLDNNSAIDDANDSPIPNVTIELFTDPNGDGDPSDGLLVGTTTTDTSGNYSFTNLLAGDYVAVETQPAGFIDVVEDEGGVDNDKPNNGTINSIAGTVDANENDANNDFVEERLGSWSGNVSLDTDDDSVIDDPDDSPIPNVTIELELQLQMKMVIILSQI